MTSPGTHRRAAAERVLLFTDAVVAIAITLLVLPLVELIPEIAEAQPDPRDVLSDNAPQMWTFLLSFVVIARFWILHHRVYAGVRWLTPAMVWTNMAWLLTIVVLPFTTDLAGTYQGSRFVACLYIGTLLCNMVIQLAMAEMIRRTPDLHDGESDERVGVRFVTGLATTAATTLVALVLSAAFPPVAYWSLLLLLVVPWAEKLVRALR